MSGTFFSRQGNSLYQKQTRKEKTERKKKKEDSRFIWEIRGSNFLFSRQGKSLPERDEKRKKKTLFKHLQLLPPPRAITTFCRRSLQGNKSQRTKSFNSCLIIKLIEHLSFELKWYFTPSLLRLHIKQFYTH
jgi:hypothetical protein